MADGAVLFGVELRDFVEAGRSRKDLHQNRIDLAEAEEPFLAVGRGVAEPGFGSGQFGHLPLPPLLDGRRETPFAAFGAARLFGARPVCRPAGLGHGFGSRKRQTVHCTRRRRSRKRKREEKSVAFRLSINVCRGRAGCRPASLWPPEPLSIVQSFAWRSSS